jgi:hypothetical protein
MDLTESIAPRSDQVNADDLVGGPITYTVREVRKGAAEQPFDFMLVETDRAYRPSKTMRRLIVAAWGPDTKDYPGRRLTLYREPSIRFGNAVVGGIRISAMSHITKRLEEKFQTTRGRRETFTVEPLAHEEPRRPAADTSHLAPLLAAFDAAGVAQDNRLAYCATLLARPISSPADLSPDDAAAVIDALHTDAAGSEGGA